MRWMASRSTTEAVSVWVIVSLISSSSARAALRHVDDHGATLDGVSPRAARRGGVVIGLDVDLDLAALASRIEASGPPQDRRVWSAGPPAWSRPSKRSAAAR